jgi:hypothetical protein
MDSELTEAFSEQNTLFTPPAPQWGDIVRMTFRIIPNKCIHRLLSIQNVIYCTSLSRNIK